MSVDKLQAAGQRNSKDDSARAYILLFSVKCWEVEGIHYKDFSFLQRAGLKVQPIQKGKLLDSPSPASTSSFLPPCPLKTVPNMAASLHFLYYPPPTDTKESPTPPKLSLFPQNRKETDRNSSHLAIYYICGIKPVTLL